MTQGEYNLLLSRKYEKVFFNHQTFLRKKELYKLKKGGCVYLIIMSDDKKDTETKVGMSRDITDRVGGYRTANPFCKVLFILYTEDCVLLETVIKRKFEPQIYLNNREFITGIETEKIKNTIRDIADMMGLQYTMETQEELDEFNNHNIKLTRQPDIQDAASASASASVPILLTKRCGGITHTTEESRMVPLNDFFRNKGNEDGVNRICKDCHLVGIYGNKRRIKKHVTIPPYNESTHKWCNRCENVRARTEFFTSKDTKDGLCANCKVCKNEQKKQTREKKITDSEKD